jgi:hypothetical protein
MDVRFPYGSTDIVRRYAIGLHYRALEALRLNSSTACRDASFDTVV